MQKLLSTVGPVTLNPRIPKNRPVSVRGQRLYQVQARERRIQGRVQAWGLQWGV